MSEISPLYDITELKLVTEWMKGVINAFEKGSLDKKTTASVTKKTLKKLEQFIPNPEERENYDKILDLCISLSTIERAEGNFEKFYLDSLKEELENIASILKGE